MKSHPGEYLLQSTVEEYKADGVVIIDTVEICLLEVLGKYGLSDTSRFGYDHVKGAFGALSFLRKIFSKKL